ncbi:serine protease hepsin-like [Poecilia latipinna]|uniref:serine protease hepsin-like n=1 Tax=Poecilia latipinna TaxID=48699 RepID=UPI00072ECB58|nr:PREDICTED: serine protease hepsin-like [Poecilia latipinna]
MIRKPAERLSLWIRSRWRCTVLTFDLHPWRRHAAADRWDAWLGLHAQGQSNQWTEQRKVKRIVVHPDYDRVSLDGDIALMELEPDLILNQNIWPVCLPSAAHHFPAGQEAWITGWGATVEGGEALLLRTGSTGLFCEGSKFTETQNNAAVLYVPQATRHLPTKTSESGFPVSSSLQVIRILNLFSLKVSKLFTVCSSKTLSIIQPSDLHGEIKSCQ